MVVKDKVVEDDEESDGFSDEDTDYSSSGSDSTSDIEMTGGYYTREMFLKKYKYHIFKIFRQIRNYLLVVHYLIFLFTTIMYI